MAAGVAAGKLLGGLARGTVTLRAACAAAGSPPPLPAGAVRELRGGPGGGPCFFNRGLRPSEARSTCWRAAVARAGRAGPRQLASESTPAGGIQAGAAFDVVVQPGQPLQQLVDGCPDGGRVLIEVGVHEWPDGLRLGKGRRVHVVGAPGATVRSSSGPAITSAAAEATVEGLMLRRECAELSRKESVVQVATGRLTVERCDIAATGPDGEKSIAVCADGRGACLTIRNSVIGPSWKGIVVEGSSNRGAIEGNQIGSCSGAGICIERRASPAVVDNTFAPQSKYAIAGFSPLSVPLIANNTMVGDADCCGMSLWAAAKLGPNAISGCGLGKVCGGSADTWRAANPAQSFDAVVSPGQPLVAGRVLLMPGAHAFMPGLRLKEHVLIDTCEA